MQASTGPPPLPTFLIDPLSEKIKQRLLKKGVCPTPKIIHTLRKKHLQKSLRKSKRLASQSPPDPLPQSHSKPLSEEDFYFQTISREYKKFTRALEPKSKGSELMGAANKMVGRPWEPLDSEKLKELASGYEGKEQIDVRKLNYEHLRELGQVFEQRKLETLSSFLDDDIELEDGILEGENASGSLNRRRLSDAEAIRILVDRLSAREITMKDWKFTRMMKQSGLRYTEDQLLRILGRLGDRGCWRQAMEVVEWVYSRKEQRHYKSRFVYTKLLAVLGKARRPQEALRIFKQMRGDHHIYPDMAAYHSIAVPLGQAGMVRELMNVIECMKGKPSRTIKNMHRKNWDPILQPDIVVFNSLLNACVPSHQWKGVSWVFEQLRKGGLKPNGATYGLSMEVMLHSGKYDLVHELFQKMKRSGEAPRAQTYKVIVKTFWKEGKVDAAIQAVREMEQRGIIGSASVYYELACCLCNNGRWQEAMMEIEKLKKLRHSKPLAVAFTGMILSSMDGGHVDDCVSVFECMQDHCAPNIGTINAMLKVYGRSDMFLEAKELFENIKKSAVGTIASSSEDDTPLVPDIYTYGSMLEASGLAHQWEYFEYVYKEMCFSGYHLHQDKHATLLVKASRAGKWHLLEHAFDTTLEAGDIPHPTVFTEMVCQAMFRGEYGKAAKIISAMSHASFQLNEKDWTVLFEKNRDRISDEHLKKLSDMLLCNCDMPEESTVSELLKALDSICGSVSTNNKGTNRMKTLFTAGDKKLQDDYVDLDEISAVESNDEDDKASSFNNSLSFADVASTESGDWFDYESLHAQLHIENVVDEAEASDISDSEADDFDELELPTAGDILKSWKKMKSQDETKFPSSLGSD